MRRRSVVALPCFAAMSAFAVFAACDGDNGTARPGDGTFRIVHRAEAQWKGERGRAEMESALDRLPQIDAVYAHNDPMAKGAFDAARGKGRTGIKFIGIDALPDEGRKYVADGVLDATIEYPTGGEEAVNAALLAVLGDTLNKDITLGTRIWTRDNLAAGGLVVPGEGIGLNLVAAQLPDRLAAKFAGGERIRIGMAQCTTDEPWRVAMNADIQRQAARYPQVELLLQSANDDAERQRTIVRQFIEQGCHAILVSPKESMVLTAPCREAMQKGIKVIVLDRKLGSDDYTCFIGADNRAIGRAAGELVKRLLPGGGNIVELQGLMTSSPAQERGAGFAEALGLPAGR